MDQLDLQMLAEVRVADAESLLRDGRWAATYYLLGYAVECGLNACAAKQCHEHEVPDRKVVDDFYTHRLDRLLNISGVKAALEAHAATDPQFDVNWNTVRDWNETSRYNHSTTEAKARALFVAVADPSSGVLPWLKSHW